MIGGWDDRERALRSAIAGVRRINLRLLAILPQWRYDGEDAVATQKEAAVREAVAAFFRLHGKDAEAAIGAFLDAMGRFSFDEFPRDWPEMWRMAYSSREIQWRLRRHFPGNAFFDRVFHEELAFFKPLLPSAQKEHCRAYWELMRRVIGYSRRVLLRLSDSAATSLASAMLQPVCIAEVGESVLQKLADAVGGMRKCRPPRRGVVGSEGCRGRQTPFMARQREVFLEFLKIYPVTASVSRVTRARSCWAAHRTSWDEAANRGDGYSGYKALANAKLA